MDSSFLIIIAVGIVVTFFILLKINGVKFSSLFKKKKKEPKAKQEKKEKLNFLPKAILTKPKIFSKKEKKEVNQTQDLVPIKQVKKTQTPKVVDPNKVQKVSKADFEKYKIEIPKTSNLYSENERLQFLKNQAAKKTNNDELIKFPSFPKSTENTKSNDKPSFNFDDLDFDDFDEDDDFDELFGDLDFSPNKESVPKISGKLTDLQDDKSVKNNDFENFIDKKNLLDISKSTEPLKKSFSYPDGAILDKRKTSSKYADVFGAVGKDTNTFVKELVLSNMLGEPAYKSRRKREEDRKKRLGFM